MSRRTERKKAQLKRQKRRFFEQQNGKCYYCGRQMVFGGGRKDDTATLEHLDDRFDPMRGKHPPGVVRRVLACHKCNYERGIERQKEFDGKQVQRRLQDRREQGVSKRNGG